MVRIVFICIMKGLNNANNQIMQKLVMGIVMIRTIMKNVIGMGEIAVAIMCVLNTVISVNVSNLLLS